MKQNMDEGSEPEEEETTEEAAAKKNNTEEEDDGTKDGSRTNTTGNEVKAPGGQEDPTKQDME